MKTITTSENIARRFVGETMSNRQVNIVPKSSSPPKLKGHGYYFTTLGGKPIAHPNAYGWPMTYHHSTYYVEVGEKWIKKIQKRLENPPKGMKWRRDSNGIFAERITDKMDFHIRLSDFARNDLNSYIRKSMARNYSLRLQTRKEEKIKNEQLASCRVLLEDSRRAGNCLEGTLVFAEKRLGLNREMILAAPHFIGVNGINLLTTNDSRARAAVIEAWKRETTVCI